VAVQMADGMGGIETLMVNHGTDDVQRWRALVRWDNGIQDIERNQKGNTEQEQEHETGTPTQEQDQHNSTEDIKQRSVKGDENMVSI